jgi:Right handed beta helix region
MKRGQASDPPGAVVGRRDVLVALVASAAGLGGGVAWTRNGNRIESSFSGRPVGTAVVAASDAADELKSAADFVCDGRHDQEKIQQAIERCGPGGMVLLSPGTFAISAPIRLTSAVALQGVGRATVLEATDIAQATDHSRPGGVVELASGSTHRTALRHVTIDGGEAKAACKGIYYNVDSYPSDQPTGPDPLHLIEDVHVLRTGSSGVHLTGGSHRSSLVTGIRVFSAGDSMPVPGFLLECYDSFFAQCESGAASGDGIRLEGSNNRITGCKSWYSRRNGFHIAGVRNQFAACESQDNARHGFYVEAGPNSFIGCHADSNSRPEAGGQHSTFDGFHLPYSEAVQCVGCQSYDRRESGGSSQRYGFYIGQGSRYCQVMGIARHNVAGPTGGDGLKSPGTLVTVAGG